MSQNAVNTYVFKVDIKCTKCMKTLGKALDTLKDKGIEEYNIELEEQKVEVKSTLPADEILKLIKSTGKEATLVSRS